MGKNCEFCAQWQEHCYWSHIPDENKHFFKLMVGDFTESMSLPGRFAKNLNGRFSEDTNLKSPSGKSWSIGVASDGDEVILRSGWKEFVDEHGIGEGDCLLFKYSGASSFDVLMFGSNGCEKTSTRCVKNRPCGIAVNPAAEATRHGCPAFSKTQDRAPHSPPENGDVAGLQMALSPPANVDVAGLQMTLHRNTGKHLGAVGREIVLWRASSKGRWLVRYASGDNYRGISGRGWRDFTRHNGILPHDICLFELVEGARRPAATVHVLRKVRGRLVLVP